MMVPLQLGVMFIMAVLCPSSGIYTDIVAANMAFAALKDDGSIASWVRAKEVVLVNLILGYTTIVSNYQHNSICCNKFHWSC